MNVEVGLDADMDVWEGCFIGEARLAGLPRHYETNAVKQHQKQ
jgi:hypothetical protein